MAGDRVRRLLFTFHESFSHSQLCIGRRPLPRSRKPQMQKFCGLSWFWDDRRPLGHNPEGMSESVMRPEQDQDKASSDSGSWFELCVTVRTPGGKRKMRMVIATPKLRDWSTKIAVRDAAFC